MRCGGIEGFRLADEFAVDAGQAAEVLLIARDADVDRLAEQIGQAKLGILPALRIAQVLGNAIAEAKRPSNSRIRMRPPSGVMRDP